MSIHRKPSANSDILNRHKQHQEEQVKAIERYNSTHQFRNYTYWMRVDQPILQHFEDDRKGKSPSELSGDLLLGIAIGYLSAHPPNYRQRALESCLAAAKADPPSCVAQGLVIDLAGAFSAGRKGWAQKIDISVEQMLFGAARSGSWLSATALAKVNPGRATEAHQIHISNGGYNSERLGGRGDQADIGESKDLHLMAMLGRVDMIRNIIQASPTSVNTRNEAGETPLYKACAAGHYQTIKTLLEGGADASITETSSRISCLHWLFQVEAEHMDETCTLLLAQGACIESRAVSMLGKDRRRIEADHFPFHWPHGTPLHWACHANSFQAARLLIQHGAHVDAEDNPIATRQYTALGLAMLRANSAMVTFLLEQNADPNWTNKDGITPLQILASATENHNISMPQRLLRWGYLGSWENCFSETTACVEAFRRHGGHLNTMTTRAPKNNALLKATEHGDSAVVLALVKAGANVNIVEPWSGRLPLHSWVLVDPEVSIYPEAYYLVLEQLLSRTHDRTAKDTLDGNSLCHLILNNAGTAATSIEMIRWLQEHSPQFLDLEAVNKRGETPLLISAQNVGNKGSDALLLCQTLLDLGADPTCRDKNGRGLLWELTKNHTISDEPCLNALKRLLDGLGDCEKREALNTSRCSKTRRTALMNMAGNGYI